MPQLTPDQIENGHVLLDAVAKFIARVKFSETQTEAVTVKVLDVDETGMAYVEYPSGLTGTHWADSLEALTK